MSNFNPTVANRPVIERVILYITKITPLFYSNLDDRYVTAYCVIGYTTSGTKYVLDITAKELTYYDLHIDNVYSILIECAIANVTQYVHKRIGELLYHDNTANYILGVNKYDKPSFAIGVYMNKPTDWELLYIVAGKDITINLSLA